MTRYNSTIKVHCKCKACTGNPKKAKVPTMSCYGYFYGHLPEDLKEKAGTKRKVAQKNRNKRVALAKNLHIAQKEANKKEEGTPVWKVELFYMLAATEIRKSPYCWETGEYISESDYRNATAHIFPKSIFVSISTHPLNYLILSPRNGSHDKTHRLDTFSKMKVFRVAVERFRILLPLITEKHKYLNTFSELAEQFQYENIPRETIIDNSLNI